MANDSSERIHRPTLDALERRGLHLVSVLGEGPTCIVYEAQSLLSTQRPRAVRLLRRELADDLAASDLLQREIRFIAGLRHPNLVEVVESGLLPDGRPLAVMERLSGRTLRRELLTRGAIPALESVQWARQALAVASVLYCAGSRRVDTTLDRLFVHQPVHGVRVLKLLGFGPSADFPASSGRFPIARTVHAVEEPAPGSSRFQTPATLDERGDVFAIGRILLACLCGAEHAPDQSDLRALDAGRPKAFMRALAAADSRALPRLCRTLAAALASTPSARFQSIHHFDLALADIESLLRGSSSRPPPSTG